jgi:hypothetical protein
VPLLAAEMQRLRAIVQRRWAPARRPGLRAERAFMVRA